MASKGVGIIYNIILKFSCSYFIYFNILLANVDENSKKKILSEFSRIWAKVMNERSKPKKSKLIKENQSKKNVKKRGNYLNRLVYQNMQTSSLSSTTSEESEY